MLFLLHGLLCIRRDSFGVSFLIYVRCCEQELFFSLWQMGNGLAKLAN